MVLYLENKNNYDLISFQNKEYNRGEKLTYHVVDVVHFISETVFVILELDLEEVIMSFEAPKKRG